MNSHILVTGAGGQVGMALVALLGGRAIAASTPDVDFLKPDFTAQLDALVARRTLSAVINAVAYTAVDRAEGDGKADAFRINAGAVAELAQWCAQRDVPLVHYSTDYVYDGSGEAPRNEQTKPAPINTYGASKLAGDEAVEASGARHLILRTSWVYAAQGKNFFTTIYKLIHQQEHINVVADQVGAPTYAKHLARATLAALDAALALNEFPSGIYHLCARGQASWQDFAQAIFALARTRDSSVRCHSINPIPSEGYKLPARRPLNSRLDCAKVARVLGVKLPTWEEGLKECIETYYGRQGLHTTGPQAHPAETAGG